MTRRDGSILFTSISMTAVFLTMVVTSLAYIDNSRKAATTQRFADTAEQAARSGVEWVMGFAQSNIDQESRLPRDWSAMRDGDILDPVALYAPTATDPGNVNALHSTNPNDVTGMGQVLKRTNANLQGVGEYILSRQGNYITTFKARIQQYSFSDDSPRQYRLGVIGRVRMAGNGATQRQGDPTVDERATMVAESVIVVNIGKVPTSRYAALIDIDLVRNWVPGEVVNGPVHVNRGYVDSQFEKDTHGHAFRDVAVKDAGGVDITNWSFSTGIGAKPAINVRSVMNLRTSTGSPFGAVTDAENGGALTAPKFNDEVSVTAIPAGDATYGNPDPFTVLGVSAGNNVGTAVQVDGQAFNSSSSIAGTVGNVFVSAENHRPDVLWGPGLTAAPTIMKKPIKLPVSVRDRLGAVLGGSKNVNLPSGNFPDASAWNNLADGVYIPTDNFWDFGPSSATAYDGTGNARVRGGIYVRGNVECMRMGTAVIGANQLSYYLFVLGFGNGGNPGNDTTRRTYCAVMNRTTREAYLIAWAAGANSNNVPGIGPRNGGNFTLSTYGTFSGPGGCIYGNNTTPNNFKMTGGLGADMRAYFPPPVATTFYPFNGVVFVDVSTKDPSRLNPLVAPVTGNIFALGDPGTPSTAGGTGGNMAAKRTLDTRPYECVASYRGAPASQASGVDILARGNIFIQNDIGMASLFGTVGTNTGAFPVAFPGVNVAEAKIVGLGISNDVLGIVSDKQVVLGLAAPSNTVRPAKGVAIQACIAALGDPAFDYSTGQADPNQLEGNKAYRGSFATEGLLQYYNVPEDYIVCDGLNGAVPYYYGTVPASYTAAYTTAPSGGPVSLGYPGNPVYRDWGLPVWNNFLANPNGSSTRGRAIVFGSVTVKKRGILGKGDTSYDKRFLFDRRLLTVAPPVFPSSTDVVIRTSQPHTPLTMGYLGGPAGVPTGDLRFLESLP
ncbi:MAG: hypothetical protein JWM80_5296 [Cyanobacteria bacterium RYN_339]|nr:hypothetical protein [Cyanobacteria bacterium RYN_339]